MKHVKGQKGYALLIVLLMVVLFLGLSATFMAGSLNNAKQEQTIDTSNQSVASAEMGVRYYSADFQREINIIKRAILQETQNRINEIITCFNAKDTKCDEQTELTALEDKVDKEMKDKYIQLVEKKVNDLKVLKDIKETPFPGEDVHYAITDVTIKKLNASREDVALSGTTDKDIKFLQVELNLSGESKGITKYLKGLFTLAVPNTVLSEEKSLKMETKTESAAAKLMIKETVPPKLCSQLVEDIKNNVTPFATECFMKANVGVNSDMTVTEFKNFLISKSLDPTKFTVYVENFQWNYCRNTGTSDTAIGCNQKEMAGLTVVVAKNDPFITNQRAINLNGLSRSNLVINGLLTIGSMNNTSSLPPMIQTIAVRELHVTGDISSDGLRYTNLIVLGKDSVNRIADSFMKFDNTIRIGEMGKICFDMDRIYQTNWEQFRDKVTFVETSSATAGKIIYYTKTSNLFVLPAESGGAKLSSEQRTAKHVQRYTDYEQFINSCGGNVITKNITEVPTPYINDSGVSIDVEY